MVTQSVSAIMTIESPILITLRVRAPSLLLAPSANNAVAVHVRATASDIISPEYSISQVCRTRIEYVDKCMIKFILFSIFCKFVGL